MATKSKFFRVAVEGATTDGRVIERSWIQDMAATYNRDTYGARVNCEHLRGLSPDGPFGAYGDVLALKAEDVEIEIAGRKQKRLALYAEIDPTPELVELTKKRQKIYTSIEVNPDMATSGKAYCMGIACTDSPASLGTDILQFAASKPELKLFANRKQAEGNLITEAIETQIEFVEAEEPAANPLMEFVTNLNKLFSAPGKAPPAQGGGGETGAPPANPTGAPAPESAGGAEFTAALQQAFAGLPAAITAAIKPVADDVAALKGQFTTLKTELENTPSRNHSTRPAAGGGDGRVRADC